MTTFRVDSEIGRLRKVLLHCPDLELTRLTPANMHDMLFDEIMWAERARGEQQAFADVPRARGAWCAARDAEAVFPSLIGGVIPEDLPFAPEGLVGASFHPTAFVL